MERYLILVGDTVRIDMGGSFEDAVARAESLWARYRDERNSGGRADIPRITVAEVQVDLARSEEAHA